MVTREYFKTARAAKITGISRELLKRGMREGYIAHIKFATRCYLIPDFEVNNLLRFKLENKCFSWRKYLEWIRNKQEHL